MRKSVALIVFSLLFLLPFAYADLGPKPDADFAVTYQGKPIDGVFYAKMLSCGNNPNNFDDFFEGDVREGFPEKLLRFTEKDSGCTWSVVIMAWGGNCKDGKCSFTYMLPEKFRLAVYLPGQDKIFLSGILTRTGMRSSFNADLSADGTIVVSDARDFAEKNNLYSFLAALVLTVLIELGVCFLYLKWKGLDLKVLKQVFTANIISLPVLWFVFPALGLDVVSVFFLGEAFAVLFEGWFIHKFNSKTLSLKHALLLSLLLNVLSVAIGLPIVFIISLAAGIL